MSNQPLDLNHNEGYSIMHSYPFISDGPTSANNNSNTGGLKRKRTVETTSIKDCTRQVPPGVIHIKPTWKPVKLDEKPPFSYATIIAHAILSSEHRKLTLSEIYQWISEQYPCYSMKDHRWQNSIRHNLSLQKAFAKLERDTTAPSGKGCFWTILPGYEQQFIDNLMKRGGLGADSSSNRNKNNNNNSIISHTASHKQFKKFIDNHSSKNNSSHLFTIFRMNPTTTTTYESSSTNNKRKKPNKKHSEKKKQEEEQVVEYDSDCDSGIDLNCEVFSKKEVPASFSTLPSPTLHTPMPVMLDYQSFLLDDLMFIPSPPESTATYFSSSTPSSIINEDLFGDSRLCWSQSTNDNNFPTLGYQDDLYFGTTSYDDLLLLQNPSNYLLYNSNNEFCV